MPLPLPTIERICHIIGYLTLLERQGTQFISSKQLAHALNTTEYTIRKDISSVNVERYTRKGYNISSLKTELTQKLQLTQQRKTCIIGLGRLGTALLAYENFNENGFTIVAGFDSNINKVERIRSHIDIYSITALEEIIHKKNIEIAIIAIPAKAAQEIATRLSTTTIKGILNFSPTNITVPDTIVHLDMDFTNSLRFIAAQIRKESKSQRVRESK